MAAVGVRKNFTKFQVLADVVPQKVIKEVKPLLRKKETDFAPANDAYKRLKKEIFRIFGPKPEAAIDRELSRVMTSNPSSLARELVEDLSLCQPQLQCTCCPSFVTALWKRHLPSNVRAGIASMKLTAESFDQITQLADDIWSANKPAATVSSINMDETQPAIPYATPEVAATSSNRGSRGARGGNRGRGRGRGRGAGAGAGAGSSSTPSSNQSRYKGPKHPDLPPGPWDGCQMHHRWGKGAHFCTEPLTCKWKDIIASKPSKNQ